MADYQQSDPSRPAPLPDDDKPKEGEELLAGWVEFAELGNIVPFFLQSDEGKEWLSKTVAKQVCDDHKRGWDSSEEYRERRRENNKILTGFLKKKEFPFKDCSNAHVPMMLERLLRLSANVYSEIFLDRDTIFGVKPTGPDDYQDAEVLTLHGNFQLRNELTDFLTQQEIGVFEFFNSGSVFSHSWYDTINRRNRHDILNCEEFVIPYVWTTIMVDLSDVPYKIRIVRKYKNELHSLQDKKTWAQIDEVLSKPAPGWNVSDTPNREQAAQREGFVAPEADPFAPYEFFAYDGWIRMPGEKTERPVCAIVESQRKIVVQLYIRDEEDWRDRERFDTQTGELERYTNDLQQHQSVLMQQQELQMRMSSPDVDPTERDMIMQAIEQDQVPEPVPPPWFKPEEGITEPEPVRRVPVENFAHGRCIYNPSGALGLSFGTVLAELNKLADESLNRLYDSATLANIWSLIVPEGLDLGGNSLAMTPGRIFRAKGVVMDNLRNQIVELRAGQANPQLMDIVRFAGDNADSAVAAPGVLSGEPGKSGETFRGIATRVERATKQLSAAGIRYLQFLDRILVNNARLNAMFLPESEIVSVNNHLVGVEGNDPTSGPVKQITVGRDLYRRSYAVTFTADVRFASQAQRISEADEIVAMVGQIPPLQTNNALLYAAVAEAFRARGKQNLIPLLGPPPPPPEVPLGTPPPPPPGMAPGGPPGPPPPGGPPPGPPPGPPMPPPGIPLPAVAPGPIQGPRPVPPA